MPWAYAVLMDIDDPQPPDAELSCPYPFDSELIQAPVPHSLPTSDTLDPHYHQGRQHI